MGLKKLNFYEVELVTVCPYCGDAVQTDPHYGCCGEVHSEEVYQTEDGETYQLDEVELYRPIKDVIRYEILNKHVWRLRLQRVRYHLEKLYDGSKWDYKTQSVKFSLIRRLR